MHFGPKTFRGVVSIAIRLLEACSLLHELPTAYNAFGLRVSDLRVNGEPIDLQKMYSVAGYWYVDNPDLINRHKALDIKVLRSRRTTSGPTASRCSRTGTVPRWTRPTSSPSTCKACPTMRSTPHRRASGCGVRCPAPWARTGRSSRGGAWHVLITEGVAGVPRRVHARGPGACAPISGVCGVAVLQR